VGFCGSLAPNNRANNAAVAKGRQKIAHGFDGLAVSELRKLQRIDQSRASYSITWMASVTFFSGVVTLSEITTEKRTAWTDKGWRL